MDPAELIEGMYLTNELRLYEVADIKPNAVFIRNVSTEYPIWLPKSVLRSYREVIPEPDLVDTLA